jgi:hypothetical protein
MLTKAQKYSLAATLSTSSVEAVIANLRRNLVGEHLNEAETFVNLIAPKMKGSKGYVPKAVIRLLKG